MYCFEKNEENMDLSHIHLPVFQSHNFKKYILHG